MQKLIRTRTIDSEGEGRNSSRFVSTVLLFSILLGSLQGLLAQPLSAWQVRCVKQTATPDTLAAVNANTYHQGAWFNAKATPAVNDLFCNHAGGCNAACNSVQWFDWEYKAPLFANASAKSQYAHHRIKIKTWEGGSMEMRINGKKITGYETEFNNSFTHCEINIDAYLQEGNHDTINIIYHAPTIEGRARCSQDAYAPIVQNEQSNDALKASVYLRKPIMQYGWDIAPAHVLVGLGDGVELVGWNDYYLQSIDINKVNNTYKPDSIAELVSYKVQVHYQKKKESKPLQFLVSVSSNILKMDSSLVRIYPDTVNTSQASSIKNSNTTEGIYSCTVVFISPRKWYPNGRFQQVYGDSMPALYIIKATTTSNTGSEPLSIQKQIGIRSITLDKRNTGFRFMVNNQPIYALGANMVWSRSFDGSSFQEDAWLGARTNTNDSARVNPDRLKQLQLAGVNMLRIWGGGAYPSDAFYTRCDELGLMVWQDLMFSGATYPMDSMQRKSYILECKQQAQEKQSHPALALWCGNNEIEVAWKYWGWQNQYNIHRADSVRRWKDYLRLFDSLIPQTIHAYDNSTPYLRSSPVGNYGNEAQMTQGDNHDWRVWHGEQPFETVWDTRMRFVSEFGFPSFPAMANDEYFEHPEKYLLSYKGMRVLSDYILQNIDTTPVSKEVMRYLNHFKTGSTSTHVPHLNEKEQTELIRLSQAVQAKYLAMAIRSQRMQAPYCNGSLLWQLNDVWPGITWSITEANGAPKPAYDVMRSAFKPVICMMQFDTSMQVKAGVHSMLWNNTTVDAKITFYIIDSTSNVQVEGMSKSLHYILTGQKNPDAAARWQYIPLTNAERRRLKVAKRVVVVMEVLPVTSPNLSTPGDRYEVMWR